uniref:Cytochrome n=1 Tax=Haemonchus placei TaxID=6290 RepID=A0A0N4X4R2_HAEPC
LLNVCMDFYLAGMETTTTTLRWATLLFASHPEVQEKVREEIMKVIGPDGKPTTSVKQKLPYTNATIQELQRWANIVAMNAVHRTVRDTSVRGVKIPADTLVLGEIHQILAHSPVFKDGHKFRPERFLMEDGVTPNKEAVDHLCPFSMGKRQCAGEALARVELFIGVITLLQNYRIEPAKGRDIDLEPIPAGILLPKIWALNILINIGKFNSLRFVDSYDLFANKTDLKQNWAKTEIVEFKSAFTTQSEDEVCIVRSAENVYRRIAQITKVAVLLLLTTAVAIYIWRFYENTKRYPKGPRPYPFVGNLISLNFTRIHEEFARCTKEYGNIFTVYLPKPHVVITDFDGVKEAFVKKGDDFLGRSGIFPDTIFQNVENGGVIFSQGENWREQRRASLHILRDFGMGKNLMEEQVLLSAQDFLAHLSSIKNKDEVCLREPIQVFIGNIINKTLYGFSYEYNKSGRMMDAANELTTVFEAMKKSPLTFVGQLFPIIYRLPIIGHLSKGRFEDMIAGLRRTIKEDVARALESYSVDQEPECLVQAYYQRMQNDPNLNYENLLNVCMDFYLAGMETTTTTLRWATLLFASHPEVQDKVREEILRVIGPEGKPTTSDRQKLPYTK